VAVRQAETNSSSPGHATLPGLIDKFNKQNEGKIKVTQRVMPQDTGQYFDQIRTEFQAGGGDVIWPAQFAANSWISDLSDRFTDTDAFLPGPMQANTYDGKVWGVPWYTDAGMFYFLRAPKDLGGAQGDGPQDGAGHGYAERLRLPGRREQRSRVHPDAWGRRPRPRRPFEGDHRQL
jgi:hypothetical protein